MKKSYLLLSGALFAFAMANAQQNTVAAGESFTSANGSVSFSIGQIDYVSYQGSEQISEGVQQPIIVKAEENSLAEQLGVKMNVFPNPTSNALTIQLSDFVENLNYKLFDVSGKNVLLGNMLSEITTISLASYASGMYIIQIYQNQQPIQSIQIIKN